MVILLPLGYSKKCFNSELGSRLQMRDSEAIKLFLLPSHLAPFPEQTCKTLYQKHVEESIIPRGRRRRERRKKKKGKEEGREEERKGRREGGKKTLHIRKTLRRYLSVHEKVAYK